MSKVTKTILILLLMAALALTVVIWWIHQRNIASRADILMELIAPESVVVGQPIEYILRIKNQGNFSLSNAELMFEFPRHAQPIEPAQNIVRQKLEQDIYPGQEQQFAFQARVFGQEEEALTAKVRLDYQIEGLRVYYSADTSATTTIAAVPLTLEFSLPQTAAPDQDFQFSLNYFSTLDETLENVGIRFMATRGFELKDSSPAGTDEAGEWQIPFLVSQDGGRIRLTGRAGADVPEVVLSAQLGVWTDQGFVPIKHISQKLEISEDPLRLAIQVNGSFDYVANPGDSLHYQIYFRNITERPLENQFLTIYLKGDYFDLESLRATRGTYQPGHDSILWDWMVVPELRFLDRDEEGQVDFWIDLKDEWPVRSLSPQVEIEVEVGSMRNVFATKINSQLYLTQQVYAGSEFFSDQGPIPLQLDQTTAYTVFWELTNTYNAVDDIWVAVNLPPERILTENIFPVDEYENLTLQDDGRRLVWAVGRLEPEQQAILAFQLAVQPQSLEALESPLIGAVEGRGRDLWSNQVLSFEALEVREVSQMPEESPFN